MLLWSMEREYEQVVNLPRATKEQFSCDSSLAVGNEIGVIFLKGAFELHFLYNTQSIQ